MDAGDGLRPGGTGPADRRQRPSGAGPGPGSRVGREGTCREGKEKEEAPQTPQTPQTPQEGIRPGEPSQETPPQEASQETPPQEEDECRGADRRRSSSGVRENEERATCPPREPETAGGRLFPVRRPVLICLFLQFKRGVEMIRRITAALVPVLTVAFLFIPLSPGAQPKGVDSSALNDLSMEVAALLTLHKFEMTRQQLEVLRKLAPETAPIPTDRDTAKANDQCRQVLTNLRAALLEEKRDEDRIGE